MKTVHQREKWVDDVKIVACILVVLGHFFQSMTKVDLLPADHLYEWFNKTIYYFHVPLFFICSGYLYQKYSEVNKGRSWLNNVIKKALTLGIPYFVFSTATWFLKTVFSSDVNDQIGGLVDTLFLHPTAPYWYLYCLFFIFLVTPTFSDLRMAIVGVVIAFLAKFFAIIVGEGYKVVYVVSTVLSNEIWFVLGMNIVVFDIQLKGKKLLATVCGVVFIGLSIVVYAMV